MKSTAVPLRFWRSLDERKDLRLRRHVERRRRLVGDEYLRIERQGHGDHGALALAAGELVGVGTRGKLRIGNADLGEQVQHPGGPLRLRHAGVNVEHLADLVADGAQRIERRHRLLEDHGDACAAHLPHLGFGELRQSRGRRT